jgi:hypothetical protein
MKAKTLVQAWLEIELESKILAQALEELNDHLGSAHSHSRVREWEENRNNRGERLPREVRLYMAKIVAKDVLQAAGLDVKKLTNRQADLIAERFC